MTWRLAETFASGAITMPRREPERRDGGIEEVVLCQSFDIFCQVSKVLSHDVSKTWITKGGFVQLIVAMGNLAKSILCNGRC